MAKKKTAKKTKLPPHAVEPIRVGTVDAVVELQKAVAKLAAKVLSVNSRMDRLVDALTKCKKVKGI